MNKKAIPGSNIFNEMIEPVAHSAYVQTMTDSATNDPHSRCRLVLIINGHEAQNLSDKALEELLRAGDVASIIFTPQTAGGNMEEAPWQEAVEPLVKLAQSMGVATILTDYTRTAGRVGADGFQLGQDADAIREAIDKFSPKLMVGAGNIKTRHNALVIGELQPDYIMFGKPGGDIRPEPHPKNLDLASWWAAMVEIPVIVLGGSDTRSVLDVAKTGAEFVALGAAIFSPQKEAEKNSAADNIRHANQILDEQAPRF